MSKISLARQSDGSTSGGGLLAVVAYNPGTLAVYTTTSGTAVDVDATNLAIAFTAPSSGKVLVRLSGLCKSAGASAQEMWTLREGSSVIAAAGQSTDNASNNLFAAMPFVITGLTSGSSHTYKWAYYGTNSGFTQTLYAGGIAGPATLEVWSV